MSEVVINNNTGNKKINYQFKLLYAIGMIMIVGNHCATGGFSLFYEWFPPYAFHVPLFIFCSGYFYKEKSESDIGKYILKKVKSLLVPLYIWNFVYAMFTNLISLKGFQIGIGVNISKLFIEPITTGHQYGFNLATWFVVPLFMVEVFNVIFRKVLFVFKDNVKEYIYVAISLALGMLGIWMSASGYNVGWWLVLTRMLSFIPFYSVGFFYNKILEKWDMLPNMFYFSIVLGLQLISILYHGHTISYEMVWSKYADFNAWPFIAGFLGIAFWLRITRILEPVLGKSKVVNLIADNTFSIMVNHFLGFFVIKSIYAFLFYNTNTWCQNFDWESYHTNVYYFFMPRGVEQSRVIYVVAGLAIPILIQKGINLCKEKINKGIDDKRRLRIRYVIICSLISILSIGIAKVTSDYVVSIGGVQIPVVNNYNLGSVLYFDDANENVERYIEDGFSKDEEEYTWTDEHEAIMCFTIEENTADLLLEFTCGVYGESQNVHIYVNDNYIESLEAKGTETYKVLIPAEYVSDSTLVLKFELPDASSPEENGDGSDDRTLALSFRELTISRCP